MKTNDYYSFEEHKKLCYRINKNQPPNPHVCEGCKLVKEVPIPSLPGYTKRICAIEILLNGVDKNED